MTDPQVEFIRDAYATATADDGHWHHKDYLADLEKQKAVFDAWLAEYIRQKQEEAYDLGVETALNHAKRDDNGITLSLVTFGGDPWPHPFRKED